MEFSLGTKVPGWLIPSQSVVPLRKALIAADEPVASASFGNYQSGVLPVILEILMQALNVHLNYPSAPCDAGAGGWEPVVRL